MYNYLVEFLGTAFFVYVILATGNPIAIGAALALIILITSKMANVGYANPAVSIVMASAGKLDVKELLPYCLAQIFGGLTALEVYKRVKV